jgi:hypothetical protein
MTALFLTLAGCLGHARDSGAHGTPLHGEAPAITSIDWSCSREEETWSFEVATEHWTANGDLWLARSADYVEQHPVRSDLAAGDGSADHLVLDLAIVADWRDADPGASTAFLCDEATLSSLNLRLAVYTPGSGEVGDCRSWGADPAFFDAVEGVPACSAVWEEPDSGP